MDRYFIVFYTGLQGSAGMKTMAIEDGYLNQKELLEDITGDGAFKQAVVSNIIELTEDDFNDWIEVDETE